MATTTKCANSDCGQTKLFSRGLCSGCYNRLRRRGTLHRANAINHGGCTAEGCDRHAFAKNLCAKHYQQAQHPLRMIWRNLRSRANGSYPSSWSRFDAFLQDVGERPTTAHQLRRPNPEEPWSMDNFAWREPITVGSTTGTKEERAAYYRAWDLRKKYGLTDDHVAQMETSQLGKCPICIRPLRRLHSETGKPIRLCVDHDHISGAVRALLCDPCNKGLGAYQDDASALDRAATYIRHYQEPTNVLYYVPASKRCARR